MERVISLQAIPSRLPALLGTGGFDIYPAAKFIDLNHDGRLHLFLGSGDTRNNPHDLLLLNDSHRTLYCPGQCTSHRYGGSNWGTVSARVVDMDGDGWPDLVNAVNGPGYCEGAVQILLNNHDGTFRDATNLIAQPASPRSGIRVQLSYWIHYTRLISMAMGCRTS